MRKRVGERDKMFLVFYFVQRRCSQSKAKTHTKCCVYASVSWLVFDLFVKSERMFCVRTVRLDVHTVHTNRYNAHNYKRDFRLHIDWLSFAFFLSTTRPFACLLFFSDHKICDGTCWLRSDFLPFWCWKKDQPQHAQTASMYVRIATAAAKRLWYFVCLIGRTHIPIELVEIFTLKIMIFKLSMSFIDHRILSSIFVP